jgi:pimeloyl-ACP methyl ester carboxylesterase
LTTAHSIVSDRFEFEYFYFEGGDEFLIAFNGFGEHAANLNILTPFVNEKYSLLCINLPFHGGSLPKKTGAILTVHDLTYLIETLKKKYNFQQFALFGYSLGGKIALRIYEALPKAVGRLYLFAPDGIVLNKWYNLAMHYRISRRLFLTLVEQPRYFFGFVRLLGKLRLLHASVVKFVLAQMEHVDQRRLVYDVWRCHRDIVPNVSQIKKAISAQQTPVQLFFGKRDRVIKASIGKQFKKGLGAHCELILLDAGHQLVVEKHLKLMK